MTTIPNTLEAPPAAPGRNAIARQSILDDEREVFGYELFDRSVQIDAHTPASDAQMLFNALSSAESQPLLDRKKLFINCTHDSLAGGHLDLVAPERLVLEIPPLPVAQVENIQNHVIALRELHRRGFNLAFDYSVLTQSYASWLELASFIKFDLSLLKPQSVASFIKLAQLRSKARLVAEKVETEAQYQMVKSLDVHLFQGYWFAKPVVTHNHTVRPSQATILQLINLVRRQATTLEIEEVLKRDPTLSFNLLRFINSAGFGMRTEVTSFRHAVMLLGLKRLFKWAALLMTTSHDENLPAAVGSTAVVRGRLMELLGAEVLNAEECDNAFVVGVFSLLDVMLGMPLEEALGSVALPESVTAALLHRSGPLAPLLELTIACETGDDAAFARAAGTLGLNNNQVNWAHLQALTWAETMSD